MPDRMRGYPGQSEVTGRRLLIALLLVSVAFNVWLSWSAIERWLGFPSICEAHRTGVLTRAVDIGVFSDTGGEMETVFTLPKGLAVGDVMSPNTIGEFEPYRFAIIVTAGREGLVDYSGPVDSLHRFGYVYSADYP
ncbi:MAG: hypothetical protein ABJF88_06090 [Rhodothermales bacterium]